MHIIYQIGKSMIGVHKVPTPLPVFCPHWSALVGNNHLSDELTTSQQAWGGLQL